MLIKNILNRGITVCLPLLLFSKSFLFLLLLHHHSSFICAIISSFPPSFFRMDHVLVGRGRRPCPSAAVCQRRRSAALQIVSTLWWVSSCVTPYIKYKLYIPVHEIFNVPQMHWGILEDQSLLILSNIQQSVFSCEVAWALQWESVCDDFILILFPGWGEWAEENSTQLTCLPALLPSGCWSPGSVLGAFQEGVGQSSDLSGLYTRGQCSSFWLNDLSG